MRKMTKPERMVWNRTHADYRCRIGGVPYVLEMNLNNGATELVPLASSRKLKQLQGETAR